MPYMRWDKINKHLSNFKPARYLEIGVRTGRVGKKVKADVKWGVDPDPTNGAEKYYTDFYHLTSDNFFKALDEIGLPASLHVIFIDGLHHYDQVMRDIENSLKHLHQDGMIILHDCKPPDEASQIVPRSQIHWNGDVWKAIVKLRTRSGLGLKVETIDVDEGLGIVQFGAAEPISDPGKLTWTKLVKNRKEWLGLRPLDWERDSLKKR